MAVVVVRAYLDVSVENTLGVKIVDPLENLVTDHGYQGFLHDSLGDHVRERAALHVLHHDEQMHLHHVCLEGREDEILEETMWVYLFEVDQVGVVELLHNFDFH